MKSSKLTKESIKHLAKLAGLDLNDKEIKKFPLQLSKILDYFEVLYELDTKNIKPTAQITGLEDVSREDRADKSLPVDEVLSNTKRKYKNFFVTKAILEK